MNNFDESVEDVLSKTEGFSIQPNGDLLVNGKLIQKILLDGKEISDFGNTLLIKALTPEKVQSLQVRFNEKDEKIKESLLNEEKFVVLDIKLKKDFNKSLFGKQQLQAAYQNKLKLSGLTNVFSLNKKINVQFFGETEHSGDNEIKLSQIKNLGEDLFNKILSIPIDIDDIIY
ncbi:hypothetical protein AS361_17515 [Myroides marinus]|uniref:hypothetical protein n=1 Tax=Myroides marinus TaxID=703342 RepID=UPI0007420C94|nr:hypothetical protein [Myroides marinus]KUF46195.1 hypothetical protein AS361_17515 [Myroides marinus]